MTYYAHTLVWPLLTAVLAAILLLGARRVVARRWPKLNLFDRKQLSRHPVRFVLACAALVGIWLACAALIYGIAGRAGVKPAVEGHDHLHAGH